MKANRVLPATIGILFGLFAISAWGIAARDAHERSGDGLCEEVDYELGESVRAGLLEVEEALEVSQRCYEQFGENSYDN